ncbi:ABC transporter permease [Massilia arenosa]|uniref:ABC transporter permease n=1 Tax=Zemynaea arenosa TaxID=2561931 RepID=A0A4Y9S4V0_9BURK|nr:ABC transporter permease [Massilia arenosa]TFW16210.1 ABC transporter permease [Massilia arenosa]
MNALKALVRKDIVLYLQDRRALLLNLVMPLVLAAFFGYLFGGSGEQKTSRIDVALVMQDSGATAQKIASGLKADASLRITEMPRAQAEEAVRKGAQKAAIVIPAGFGEAAGSALFGAGEKPKIDVLYDPSQTAVLAMVRGLLTQQVMQTVSADMFGGQGGQKFTEKAMKELDANADASNAPLRDFLGSLKTFQAAQNAGTAASAAGGGSGAKSAGLTMPFTTSEQPVTSKQLAAGYNGYAHSFAGMSVQFILFMGIDMGIGILLARRMGIWSRLLAAPITLRTVLAARAVSGAIIAFGLLVVIFAAAKLIFGVTIVNLAGFVGVAVCFALLTSSFGLLIAAFGKTPEAARGIAVFATLIMVMLGGAWVPSFLFPEWMQTLTMFVPTRWAVDGFDAMTWRGLGMDAALQAMGAELLFAVVFATLAIWRFTRDAR